jgi:ABC-type branched-subunit amino acid transport system ATPase component
MDSSSQSGLYLFQKQDGDFHVLKDLLHLMKISTSKKGQFFYVEGENSLLPNLTLTENLQLVTPFENWRDFPALLNPEYRSLVNLIQRPGRPASEAETWEKFLVCLLKGLATPSEHFLINMNEETLSPFMVKKFKETLMLLSSRKTVFLATRHTSLWLDCAHSLVRRNDFKFEVEVLDAQLVKKHWEVA